MSLFKLYPALRQFSAEQTKLSLNLAKHVFASEARQRNMVLSPLSIHVVLGMIATASTGRTQQEVLGYFKSKSTHEFNTSLSQLATLLLADGPRLTCTNGVWVDQRFTLKPRFKDIVHNVYKVGAAEQADFLNKAEEERMKLNMWAKEKTNGLIEDVFVPGAWVHHFDESRTEDYDFFLSDSSSVKVPFITNSERQCVSAYDGFKVLRLPYKKGVDTRSFSMCIYLPDSTDGLTSLIEKVTSEPDFIENHIPDETVNLGTFLIPKFEIRSDFDASAVLKKLGVVSAFSGGLTEMVEENHENLFVSAISQKAFIKVNEEGTEAAVVTRGLMSGRAQGRPKTEDFVADHPFVFVIREEYTEMVLFIGQVHNPLDDS